MEERVKDAVTQGISFVLKWKEHEALWGRRDFLVQLCQALERKDCILRAAPGQLHGFSMYLNCTINSGVDRQQALSCAQCIIREHCQLLAMSTRHDPFPLEITVFARE